MKTTRIAMTGSPVAIAGPGDVIFTGTGLVYWWREDDGVAPTRRPTATHRARALQDKRITIPAGQTLWVQSKSGSYIAVSRTSSPVSAGVPVITGSPSISGDPQIGQLLSATPAVAAGTPTPTRTWQWLRNGSPISGAIAATYTLVTADNGQSITVRQTETNVNGFVSATSSAVTGYSVGGGVAPVITGAPTISGTTIVGNLLTAIHASVSGSPTPTRTWQWLRNGIAISGATSSTYTTVSADAGQPISVRQIETNASGSVNATSVATAAIRSIPAISGVPTISGTVQEGQILTATPASATGSPTPTRSWQWYRAGVAISGATSISYGLVSADVGQTIKVRQTEANTAGSQFAESTSTAAVQSAGGAAAAPVFTGFSVNWTTGQMDVTVDKPCRLYARRDTPGTDPNAASVVSGAGALQTTFFDLIAGVNTPSWAFNAGLDGNFQLSFAAREMPSGTISAVLTSTGEIDTTADAKTSSTPTDGGIDVVVSDNLIVTMADDVRSSETAVLRIQGGATIETFNLATGVGSNGGTVTLGVGTKTTDRITFNPGANLLASTVYDLDLTALRDEAGNLFTGDLIVSFTTAAGAPSSGFSDDFSSYSDDQILSTSPNWTSIIRADELDLTKRVGNFIEADNADSNPAREIVIRETALPTVKHYVEAVVQFNTLAYPGNWVALAVGYNGSNFYRAIITTGGNIELADEAYAGPGTFTNPFAATTTGTMTFRLERDEVAGTVTAYVNGVQTAQITGASQVTGGLKAGFGISLNESAQPLNAIQVISITGDSF